MYSNQNDILNTKRIHVQTIFLTLFRPSLLCRQLRLHWPRVVIWREKEKKTAVELPAKNRRVWTARVLHSCGPMTRPWPLWGFRQTNYYKSSPLRKQTKKLLALTVGHGQRLLSLKISPLSRTQIGFVWASQNAQKVITLSIFDRHHCHPPFSPPFCHSLSKTGQWSLRRRLVQNGLFLFNKFMSNI